MTSKLKCPFCGDNLRLREDCIWGLFACSHPTCEKSANMCGTKELWTALIQSQQDLEESQRATLENAQTVLEIHKDLEIARKALEKIVSDYEVDASNGWLAANAQKALEQIEHKE